jgi:DNA-directed RNA polymerase specialized sigma24 family protein
VLNGQLALHGIRDVEAYCDYHIRHSRLELNPTDHEDLLDWLITETWRLSTRYRPGPKAFTTLARERMPNLIIDWQRQRKDTRYPSNTRYTQVPLNDQLAHTHTISPLDDQAHSRTDQQRLHHQRDRSQDRPYPNLDRTPTRTAA